MKILYNNIHEVFPIYSSIHTHTGWKKYFHDGGILPLNSFIMIIIIIIIENRERKNGRWMEEFHKRGNSG